jgi:hypothetical protein
LAFGNVKFQFRAQYDVVIVHADCQLETERDISDWAAEYEKYFRTHFKRPMDVILELSKFRVNPRVASQFGEARSKLLNTVNRLSYRVKMGATTKAMMYTSNVIHGAVANDFPSIEAALEQLLKDRKLPR